MGKKLSEDGRHTIERPHVTIALTINPQQGVTDVPETLLPSLSTKLAKSLETLTERLYDEAVEIADVIESLATRTDDEPSGKVVARHCDAAKVSTDSNGSSVYLRVLITTARPVSQRKLFTLAGAIMECFRELAYEMVEAAEFGDRACVDGRRPTATLASLGTMALSARRLSDLVGTGEPQLGDRA